MGQPKVGSGRHEAVEGEVFGSFKVLTELGRGGMAVVYRGIQESLNRPVAIKVLPPEFASTPELLRRFLREAEAMATLAHPNIVQVIDRGEHNGTVYFVMEFVDGGSLKELLQESELPYDRMIDIALEVAAGLEHAHAHGIVHRDLKPGNVLIERRSGMAKIADFGIAQFKGGAEALTLTSSNVSMGTLNYMSPEQKVDAHNVDHRTDIYSLGVILYEMLTGSLPLGSFDPPSGVNRAIPRSADAVILKALKTSPDARYQTIAEMAADLRRLKANAASVGVISRAIQGAGALTEYASQTVTSKKGRWVLALLVVLMLAGGALYAGFLHQETRSKEQGGSVASSTGRSTLASSSASTSVSTDPSAAARAEAQSARAAAGSARIAADLAGGKEEDSADYQRGLDLQNTAGESFKDGDFASALEGFKRARELFELAKAKGEKAAEAARTSSSASTGGSSAGASTLASAAASSGGSAGRSSGTSTLASTGTSADTSTSAGTVASTGSTTAASTGASSSSGGGISPELLEANEQARDRMEGAQHQAEEASAKDLAREEYKRGEGARDEGRRLALHAELEKSTSSYGDAEKAFLEAAEKARTVAAVNAHAKALAIAAEGEMARARRAVQGGGPETAQERGRAEELERTARALFGKRDFDGASAKFDEARQSYLTAAKLARAEDEGAVGAAKREAAGEREDAGRAGAADRAAKTYEQAELEERAGGDALAQGRLRDARGHFEKARDLYKKAEGEALAAAGSSSGSSGTGTSDASGSDGGAGGPVTPATTLEAAATSALVQAGKGMGQASWPKGLDLDASGAIYLGDCDKKTVTKFGPDGQLIWEAQIGLKPYDLGVARDGQSVWVAAAEAKVVVRLDAGGGGQAGQLSGSFGFPNAVSVATGGDIYVYDSGSKCVWHFGVDGGLQGSFPAGSQKYAGLAADSRGRVYFTDDEHHVKRFDPATNTSAPFASAIMPYHCTAIAVDDRDRVYICDEYKYHARVVAVSADGTVLRTLTNGPAGTFAQPFGVAAVGSRLAILDWASRTQKVSIFEIK